MRHIMKEMRSSLFYLLLVAVLLGAFFVMLHSFENTAFNNEPCFELNDGWYADQSFAGEPLSLPALLAPDDQNIVRAFFRLPFDLTGINSVCIPTANQSIRVLLDGKELYTRGVDPLKRAFGKASGNAWNLVRLPTGSAGKSLSVELSSPYEREGVLRVCYGGTKASILFFLLGRYVGGFLVSGAILLIGILLLIIAVVIRRKMKLQTPLSHLGWFAVLTSVRLLGENQLSPLLFGNQILVLYLNYECLMLFPIPALLYIRALPAYRYKKPVTGLILLHGLNAVVLTLLQFCGVADFFHTVLATHALLLLTCTFLLFAFMDELFVRRSEESSMPAIAFLTLGTFTILDLWHSYFSVGAESGCYMRVGILLFLLILSCETLKKASSVLELSRSATYYHRMATTDFMTQCQNRTAYTRDLAAIGSGSGVSVILADINCLKKINDLYGHRKGDEAIELTGRCVRLAFHESCTCYRIGGDEFLCFLYGWSAAKIADASAQFMRECASHGKNCDYEFSVALGSASFDPALDASLADTVSRADHQMYVIKGDMKENPSPTL